MNLIDRTSLLWRGGLSLGPVRTPPTDRPPATTPDATTVAAGGTVTSDVLANDADPEGGALTLLAATADVGSVTVESGGTLAYTAPSDFAGTATITYTVADPAGNTSQGTVAVEVVRLSIAEGETSGEFVVSSAPGKLTITVTEPVEHAGSYALKTADLAAGPINLAPPRIAGTAASGETLTALPGLWAFEEAGGPLTVDRVWLRGATPIDGATGATHSVGAADAGEALSVVETARTAAGAREAASAGLVVPAAPEDEPWTPAALPGLALWFDVSDAATLTVSGSDVTAVADKSGNGRNLMALTGRPAPVRDATLNGKPVLRLPESSLLRSTGAPLPGLPGMPGVSVIAVTRGHVWSGFKNCFSLQNAAAAGGQAIFVQTGYSIMWFGNGNRYWNVPVSGPVVAVAQYPRNGTHGGTEWWRNGTRLSPTSTANSGNAVSLPADAFFQVGNQSGATSEPAECVLVTGPLSAADRERAEGYLAHKWGLDSDLPDTHPYKAAPPARVDTIP